MHSDQNSNAQMNKFFSSVWRLQTSKNFIAWGLIHSHLQYFPHLLKLRHLKFFLCIWVFFMFFTKTPVNDIKNNALKYKKKSFFLDDIPVVVKSPCKIWITPSKPPKTTNMRYKISSRCTSEDVFSRVWFDFGVNVDFKAHNWHCLDWHFCQKSVRLDRNVQYCTYISVALVFLGGFTFRECENKCYVNHSNYAFIYNL